MNQRRAGQSLQARADQIIAELAADGFGPEHAAQLLAVALGKICGRNFEPGAEATRSMQRLAERWVASALEINPNWSFGLWRG